MESIRVETQVGKDGTLTVAGLPFREGAVVEVSISLQAPLNSASSSHPLQGLPVTYIDPFEPATAPEDWEALR